MSIAPPPPVEKYCFVYCGPERCDCWSGKLFDDPFASVGRNPQGEDREDGLRAEHEHAVPNEDSGDAQ